MAVYFSTPCEQMVFLFLSSMLRSEVKQLNPIVVYMNVRTNSKDNPIVATPSALSLPSYF
jgi:hypothetical protein